LGGAGKHAPPALDAPLLPPSAPWCTTSCGGLSKRTLSPELRMLCDTANKTPGGHVNELGEQAEGV
jgi:hypothetical protein